MDRDAQVHAAPWIWVEKEVRPWKMKKYPGKLDKRQEDPYEGK